MKFKLDENFRTRAQRIFCDRGHDIQTVRDESLQGSSDRRIYDICCTENHCLVALDLDFADPTRFPSKKAGGIVVIRIPRNPNLPLLEAMIAHFLGALEREPFEQDLWIVEPGRIRIHQTETRSK